MYWNLCTFKYKFSWTVGFWWKFIWRFGIDTCMYIYIQVWMMKIIILLVKGDFHTCCFYSGSVFELLRKILIDFGENYTYIQLWIQKFTLKTGTMYQSVYGNMALSSCFFCPQPLWGRGHRNTGVHPCVYVVSLVDITH